MPSSSRPTCTSSSFPPYTLPSRSSNYAIRSTLSVAPTQYISSIVVPRMSCAMSSITPPSFVDDGSSFEKRIPHGLHPAHIANWISSPESDTKSAYTGSYVDDGADMLHPNKHAPGFGPIDVHFYKQPERKESTKSGPWNEDIQKAIAGDIQRNLEKMKGIGNLEVRRVDSTGEKQRDGHGRKKKDTVTIPMPLKWASFVIKADDGRVVVIDEDGVEFDSGTSQVAQQQQPSPVRWVEAPTATYVPSLHSLAPTVSERGCSKSLSSRKDEEIECPISQTKELTPIPELEYDGYQASCGEDLVSPTGFFMTGGKGGWDAWSKTSVASFASPTRSSRQSSPLKASSPVRSPPGSWPSPPLSPTKTVSVSEKSRTGENDDVWGEKNSHCSRPSRKSPKCRPSKHNGGNVSVKSYAAYKPPTVEDAAGTSSDNASVVNDVGWGRRGPYSEQSWPSNKKESHRSSSPGFNTTHTASQSASKHHPHPPASLQNWIGSKVKTISSASTHKSRHRSRPHTRSRAPSEQTTTEPSWDGFELPKTQSVVSVLGSGSEREWPGSQASSTYHRSHGSSSFGSQSGWGGVSEHWGESQKANVDGWGGESESRNAWV